MAATGWPAAPGTYALVFSMTEPRQIEIGRLGTCCLPAGRYVYIGSALGPGGLAARLARHLRPDRRMHWHVDYLAAQCPVSQVLAWRTPDRRECAWAQRLLALPGASAPVRGFGSSDCRAGCPAHLIRLPQDFDLASLGAVLQGEIQA